MEFERNANRNIGEPAYDSRFREVNMKSTVFDSVSWQFLDPRSRLITFMRSECTVPWRPSSTEHVSFYARGNSLIKATFTRPCRVFATGRSRGGIYNAAVMRIATPRYVPDIQTTLTHLCRMMMEMGVKQRPLGNRPLATSRSSISFLFPFLSISFSPGLSSDQTKVRILVPFLSLILQDSTS